ncbi:G5 domain-containing protein, partial [Aerococcus sp. 1KP-2016]
VLGERTIVEKVTTVGGEETAREVISDEITTAPVNKVIQVGTKAAPIEDIATVVSEETRTQEVAFEIEYVNNPDLLVGTEEVSQEGVLGERTIVEKVTTVGGEETAREVISDE